MRADEPVKLAASGGPDFTTTHWSVVLQAAHATTPQASEALEKLCRAYWYPLYAYVRRCGYAIEDAQDLTQAFFAHLLQKDSLSNVQPAKGKFRSFLLTCLKHFLADERARAHTQKRGGACPPLPLDLGEAEERYLLEPSVEANPESLFERRWALDLLDHVLDRLRQEAVEAGKQTLFDQLQGHLLSVGSVTFSPDGQRLATGSSQKESVKLWDMATFQEVTTLTGQGTYFYSTIFSPDGNTIATIDLSGTAHLWRAPSLTEIQSTQAHIR